MDIDWSRVARPQADGYDILVIDSLSMLSAPDHDPTGVTFCAGWVDVCPLPSNIGGVTEADADMVAAWSTQIDGYLNTWTAGYSAIQYFLDRFYPLTWGPRMGCGSVSGHVWGTSGVPDYNAIYVSINDLQGCAQGIYHEVAHLRLHRLGIHMEDHDFRLLLNDPSELYDSSVRFDKKRPMTAVLHGVYAWLMFTTNDVRLWHSNKNTEVFKVYAERNIPKIRNGMDEIARYARWTPEGHVFYNSLVRWADALTADADTILA